MKNFTEASKSFARRNLIKRTYGVTEVASLTSLNRITLHCWDRSGFFRPSGSPGGRGTGNRRKYRFNDLVALRVIKRLRDAGVSLQALRKVARTLAKLGDSGAPFTERLICLKGRDVVLVDSGVATSLLKRPGQTYLAFPVDLEGESQRLLSELTVEAA